MSNIRLALLLCSVLVVPAACIAQTTSSPAAQDLAKKAPLPPAPFKPACAPPNYPSPPPKTSPVIDRECGLQGAGGEEANQNIAKNNFCAAGTPTDMSLDDFTNLQTKVDNDPSIPFGDTSENGRPKGPAIDRTPLQALGEGKLVSMQAYVRFGKQEGEESVNCGTAVPDEPAFHDIHIELVSEPQVTDECSGIVVEMIPHHRPDSWTANNVQAVADAKLPVRVTGQLFFDSSHFPCRNGVSVGDNPKRASLWEIHPIYQFEVCPSGTCSSGTGWQSLDQWISSKTRNGGKKK